MKTWLQLVGKAVWRRRGGEAAGLARVGSKASLSLSGGGFHGLMLYRWGEGGKNFLLLLWTCKSQVKPDPELCTTSLLDVDHSWSCPAAFSWRGGDPPVLWSKQRAGEDAAMGHLQSPTHS